jgi:hypothetical protein
LFHIHPQVTQEKEGELGHLTAASQRSSIGILALPKPPSTQLPNYLPAFSKLSFLSVCLFNSSSLFLDLQDLVSYDSGGGSFQIVACPTVEPSNSLSPARAVHEGPFGEIEALRVLEEDVRKRGLRKGVSPNPVTMAEAQQVVELLQSRLPPLQTNVAVRLKRAATRIVAIGESTSIFAIASHTLDGDRMLTVAKVQAAIERVCDKDDQAQESMGLPEVNLTLPKLCLLKAAMEFYDMSSVSLPACS